MATFIYPTSLELMAVEQQYLPTVTPDDPIFSIFPSVNKDTHILEWEQYDNYIGLQQVRGLNGEPPRVKRVGIKQYQMQPGIYGEWTAIDEREMVTRRQFGAINQPIDVTDLTTQCGMQLLVRQLMRQQFLGWTLLTTGQFLVTDVKGAILHADSYVQRTFTASVVWGTAATSTPLADFRAVQLLARGFSTNFGSGSIAYMNRTTANQLLNNTNAADLYGRRTAGLGTFNSLPMMNQLFMADDLPTVVVNDNGYYDDSNNFQLFIPNNKVVVVGKRTTGAPIGNWISTRNAVNPGCAPGPYYKVYEPAENVPPTVRVHRGVNGGHCLFFPSSIIVMNV